MKNVFLLCLCLFLHGFATAKDGVKFSPGRIFYQYKNGQVECLSEIDEKGHLSVFVSPLKYNTRFKFSKIEFEPKETVLVGIMMVDQEETICAAWIESQELMLVLHPKKVATSCLTGKVLYEKNNITVYTSETKNNLSDKPFGFYGYSH